MTTAQPVVVSDRRFDRELTQHLQGRRASKGTAAAGYLSPVLRESAIPYSRQRRRTSMRHSPFGNPMLTGILREQYTADAQAGNLSRPTAS